MTDPIYEMAGYVIYLDSLRKTGKPFRDRSFIHKDARNLIKTLDVGARDIDDEAQRMVSSSYLRQIRAGGVAVEEVLAA